MHLNYLFIFSLLILISSCSGDADVAEKIDLKEELDVEPNTFLISPNSDTLLFGTSGTALFIPAGSFNLSDSTEKEVKITLKEYYDMSDILMQDLSTEAGGGELLETGGMINIQASDSKDDNLSLKYGKEIIVHFPKNGNTADDMKLFSEGFYDRTMDANNSIIWDEEENSEGYETDSIVSWHSKKGEVDKNTLFLTDGRHIYDWVRDTIELTQEERDYVRFRDVTIKYIITKEGNLENIHYEKDYEIDKVNRLMQIVQKMPRLQPYTVNGSPIDNECWLVFGVKYVPSKYENDKDYLKSLEKKYPEFEKKSINDIDQVELNYFIFSSAKLGWLNVDRFVDDPAPKVDMALTLDDPADVTVKLIYKDYKSVISPMFSNGVHSFSGIPEEKNITLMIIRNTNDKLMMSITEHVTAQGEITGMKFKEYTLGELKTELKKLD